MQDLDGEAADAQRALDAHLAAMETAAVAIEDVLGAWAQQWCQSTVDEATAREVRRTHALEAGSTHGQFLQEVAQLKADLPLRLRAALRKMVWRHELGDTRRVGAADKPADLDFGIWEHSGYKIPPAYEGAVSNVFSRVTQLLRKYGYRPEFGSMPANHGYAAPPEAIPPMEAYYRLWMRMSEKLSTAEQARRRAFHSGSDGSWHRQ
jgi:hypothetical protein